MELVFWWPTVCRSITPLISEISNIQRYKVSLIVQEEVNEHRQMFGWEMDDPGKAKLTILSQHKKTDHALEIIREKHDAIHILGGYQRIPLHRKLIYYAINNGIYFGIMAEAPIIFSNGYKGFFKDLYIKHVIPLRTSSIPQQSRFFICLSGHRFAKCIDIGWEFQKIYPFGYFPKPREVLSREFIPENDCCRLLCTGVLAPFKGVDILVKAVSIAQKFGAKIKCDIVGDGKSRGKLERLIAELELSDIFNLHGFISDSELNKLIKQSDILVCPGINEPWGMRVNDAINCGLAIISSDGIGASELIRAGRCGIVFHAGESGELAEIIRLLAQSPKAVDALKNASRKFAPKIHPSQAAEHLVNILAYAECPDSARPNSPWFRNEFKELQINE